MVNPCLALSNNKAPFRFRSIRPFLQITPLQVSPLLPMSELLSPCSIFSNTPYRHSKKARYWSVSWGELQHIGDQPGAREYHHTHPVPLTLGNSGKEETPAPLQEFGLVPDPGLCVAVRTISSFYRSTSHTTSGGLRSCPPENVPEPNANPCRRWTHKLGNPK